jgi:hypothetical protein
MFWFLDNNFKSDQLHFIYLNQLSKTADGIKVVTDKGEELIADVVLFATGI